MDPDFAACLEDCSLLDQYPDLQVADSGLISNSRAIMAQHGLLSEDSGQPEMTLSIPDQGYLAMGASENISLDLPGSGLEPMSNSVLNGLLDKQLEKVYMQHLTDNLARCNSHLGSSILHGLVPPPQPGSLEPYSLEPSVETRSEEDSNRKISYLNTHTSAPYSSNFSSPLLRISENASVQPQWKYACIHAPCKSTRGEALPIHFSFCTATYSHTAELQNSQNSVNPRMLLSWFTHIYTMSLFTYFMTIAHINLLWSAICRYPSVLQHPDIFIFLAIKLCVSAQVHLCMCVEKKRAIYYIKANCDVHY